MMTTGVVRFGSFRLDARSGELFRDGRAVRLPPQASKLLVYLASSSGELVGREEIQKALWGEDTFVDFEHGINKCINQIRAALDDDAEKPRYIETVPRLGYRFIPQMPEGAPDETERENAASVRFFPFSLWKTAGFVALLVATAALAVELLRPTAPSHDTRMPRFQLTLPRAKRIPFMNFGVLAISPDGKKVAFVGCDDSRSRINRVGCQLFVRDQTSIDAVPLPGTEDAESPFFSPDGRFIVFGAKGKLKKIDLNHGTVVTLADAPALRGGGWVDDQTILFSRGGGGILRVSAAGGDVEEVTKPDPARREYDHRWPSILPGGRKALIEVLDLHGVFFSGSRGHSIALVDLEAGTKRVLIERGGMPKYVDGHVVFGRDGSLFAARIDPDKAMLVGEATPVLEGVSMWSSPGENDSAAGNVTYEVSRAGALIFSPREARLPRRTLVLMDRRGRESQVSSTEQAYADPIFSPDGRRIAVTVEQDVGAWEVFVIDLGSGASARVADGVPAAWMPDGERLLLDGGPRFASVDGSKPPEMLYDMDASSATVAPDGRWALFSTQAAPGNWDIWRANLTEERDAAPWLATPTWEQAPSLSPDGSWVAYHSDESGRFEIEVRHVSGTGGKHQVSTHGGLYPRWSHDGTEIIFSKEGSLWSAAVRTSPTFASDPPRKVFELPDEIRISGSRFYDVSPDGQHFVMVQKDPFELRPLDVVIVPGWIEEMKARLAAAK